MTDAADRQMIERIADALRSADLAGMNREAEPSFSCELESRGEFGKMPVPLVAAHTEAGDGGPGRLGGQARGAKGAFRTEVADCGRDEAGLDPGCAPRRIGALNHCGKVFGPCRRGTTAAEIRGKKDLGVDHTVGRRRRQNRLDKTTKIPRRLQHCAGRLVGAQEFRKIGPAISAIRIEDR